MTWIIYEFPVNQKPRQSILMAMSTRQWAKHTMLPRRGAAFEERKK